MIRTLIMLIILSLLYRRRREIYEGFRRRYYLVRMGYSAGLRGESIKTVVIGVERELNRLPERR